MGRKSPEHDLQVAIVDALRAHCPFLFWHTPNGGKRGIKTAVRLKKEGVLPGVPDIQIMLPNRSAFLELKAKRGRLTDSQIAFRQSAQAAGHWWEVAYSFDEAWAVLERWNCLPKRA